MIATRRQKIGDARFSGRSPVQSCVKPGYSTYPSVRIRSYRAGQLKLITTSAGDAMLFDLETDPNEQTDLAASRPADLARLQDELGLSYMFITHDLATVKAIADEVVVMKEGRVIEQGPKTAMFTPPHHPYTDLLLSSVPEMDPDWLDKLLAERGVEALGEAATGKM